MLGTLQSVSVSHQPGNVGIGNARVPFIYLNTPYTQHGDQTYDPEIESHMLF